MWLVVLTLWKMMDFVNGKDDNPYRKWKIKNVWNHQPDIYIYIYLLYVLCIKWILYQNLEFSQECVQINFIVKKKWCRPLTWPSGVTKPPVYHQKVMLQPGNLDSENRSSDPGSSKQTRLKCRNTLTSLGTARCHSPRIQWRSTQNHRN